ncbi:MAG: 50S ribosomal protein L18, partial [Deltaproteobacteria bacterium]|nr:50S ribosomal protein L18 [Deltaproteobacteria bacterium]
MVKTEKLDKRLNRKERIRKKVFGTESAPRVSVFRSSKHIYANVIDDSKDRVIVGK